MCRPFYLLLLLHPIVLSFWVSFVVSRSSSYSTAFWDCACFSCSSILSVPSFYSPASFPRSLLCPSSAWSLSMHRRLPKLRSHHCAIFVLHLGFLQSNSFFLVCLDSLTILFYVQLFSHFPTLISLFPSFLTFEIWFGWLWWRQGIVGIGILQYLLFGSYSMGAVHMAGFLDCFFSILSRLW